MRTSRAYDAPMPITLKDLEGYIERDMDADTAKGFADAEPVSLAASIVPVAPFLRTLPKHAATSLASFDAKIRGGKFPTIPCLDIMDDCTYGFDFVKNGVEVLDTDRNEVASEESSIEDHTQFDNLDVFLWSMIRLGAVRKKKLAKKDIANDFETLAQPGALFLLEELG
jgi:hypothetical protein